MVKMEICSDSEDQQISKLNESSLIAYRIQKVGRDARLGFGKFESNKPSSSDSDAKVFPPTNKEISFRYQQILWFASARLLRNSSRAKHSPSGKFAQQKREERRTSVGRLGRTQWFGEMPTSKQGRVSDHCTERWRIARRPPPTAIFVNQPSRRLDTNRKEHGRGIWKLLPTSGTSKELSPPPPHFRTVLCSCRARIGFGKPRCCRYKVGNERGPLSRQRKRSKRENCVKKEIEHLHSNSSQPSSDHTSRQRTRNDRPHGSGPLRPIAGRL